MLALVTIFGNGHSASVKAAENYICLVFENNTGTSVLVQIALDFIKKTCSVKT